MTTPPTDIRLHKKSQTLEVEFSHAQFTYSAEFLRVHSPSAEVKGHGKGQEILQLNKENINITHIDLQGNYALRLVFDDGHDTGLYTWQYLEDLGQNKEKLWRSYLDKVKRHNESHLTDSLKWVTPPK